MNIIEFARVVLPAEFEGTELASIEDTFAEQLYAAIKDGTVSVERTDVDAVCAGCDDLENEDEKLNFYCGMMASKVMDEYDYTPDGDRRKQGKVV